MSNRTNIFLTCLILLASLSLASAKPGPKDTKASPVQSDWLARSMAWFKSADHKAQRKEMRATTKALRKPCRYCHTPDFKGYTEKRLISQQMMALSVENGVTCADCHAGKKGLSQLGKTSKKMWAWSIEKSLFCNDCHTNGSKFKDLTPAGKRSQGEWKKRKKAP